MSEQSYTLETVEDYLGDARTLLQDTLLPYRYDDPSLLIALNTALLEGRRVRPDLFVFSRRRVIPSYTTVDDEPVPVEPQFRLAFLYATVAHALMRDQEDIEDRRIAMFLGVFNAILTGPIGSSNINPGAPQPPAQRPQ